MIKNRLHRLQPFFEKHRLDLLMIEHPANLRYLTGFSGSEATLVVAKDLSGCFISDSRYTLQAAKEVVGFEMVERSRRHDAVAELVEKVTAGRVGFEACHTTVSSHATLAERLVGTELVPVEAELDAIRDIKDTSELEALERVACLASEAFLAVLPSLRHGVRESDFALSLEFEMRRRGAESCGFDIIVASGERGAMPHGRASGKTVNSGELVTVDFGAVLDGYHSDETVTVAVGPVRDEHKKVHETVLKAHDIAISAIRPGVSCRELDAIARDYIKSQGYGDYFGHGLGHGVGLQVHEKPVISPRSEAVLEEGMVFTVEPGIYIPGCCGVRIEDTVAVTADGCRILTKVPKHLILL